VTVLFEEDGQEAEYKIVTTVRSNSLKGLISIESPLGKALLGHKNGDRISVQVNENISYHVIIKAIDKSTGCADDAIRQY
ncbi:MAG TPA: GreA/GreB family elongation factor, partial [Lachnospiraceae bacterium]|nr:GreA/GreB family elongation factor [Lachnospiraceae bacterium]